MQNRSEETPEPQSLIKIEIARREPYVMLITTQKAKRPKVIRFECLLVVVDNANRSHILETPAISILAKAASSKWHLRKAAGCKEIMQA